MKKLFFYLKTLLTNIFLLKDSLNVKKIVMFTGSYMIPVGFIVFFLLNYSLENLCEFLLINYQPNIVFIITCILGPSMIVCGRNCYKLICKDSDIRLFQSFNKSSLSKDKSNVIHPKPPKKYLSNIFDGWTLGKYRGKYFRIPYNPNTVISATIIGAPGSGKTSTLLTSLIYNLNFAKDDEKMTVFALDPKPELYLLSADTTKKNIRVIDPSTALGTGFDVYYGLTKKSSQDDVISRLRKIGDVVIQDSDEPIFSDSARNLFVGFMGCSFYQGLGFIDSIIKIVSVPMVDLVAEFLSNKELTNNYPKLTNYLRPYSGDQSETLQSFEVTLRQSLNIFQSDSMRYKFQDCLDMTNPIELLDGTSIFLAIPDHLLSEYGVVFSLITDLTLRGLMSVPDIERKGKNQVYLLLDELGSLPKLPGLVEFLARGRSRGYTCWCCCQGLEQLKKYGLKGQNGSQMIIDNTEAVIVFGAKDQATLKLLSDWSGVYRETKHSSSQQGLIGNVSVSQSVEYRNIIEPSDILKLRSNNEVLVFIEGRFYVIDRFPYFKIKELREKSEELLEKNKKEGE